MFSNYLMIALRNIRKNKVFSNINFTGLALGLACSIIILMWVREEISNDQFHEDHQLIYRIVPETKAVCLKKIIEHYEPGWNLVQIGESSDNNISMMFRENNYAGRYSHV